VGGSLAVGAHLVAQLGGEKGEPILLAVFIFIAGTVYIKHTSMEWRLVISSDLSCHVLVRLRFTPHVVTLVHGGGSRSVASAATFSRFIPEVKARYDYGVLIFILTFAMVAVSSYRVKDLIEFAHERVTTIAVGVATCLFTTVFVFPVWAGEDLHNLAAGNLDKLAEFLEGTEQLYQ